MDHWPIPGAYKLIIGLKRVKVMYQLTKIDFILTRRLSSGNEECF